MVIEEREIRRKNRKYRFPFEKWILRNGQPVRYDNHIIFVAMIDFNLGETQNIFFFKDQVLI